MKNRNEIKEHKEDMTIEEYRKELHRIFENMEDIQLLRLFYLYAVNRIKRDHTVDCGVSCANYKDLIVEMTEKIDNENFLRRICIILNDYLRKKPK